MNNDLILGGGVPQIGGPKIDPSDFKTKTCKHCHGFLFEPRVIIKEISGTLVGRGTEPVQMPLQVFVCSNCGAILDEDIKAYKLENDIKQFDEYQHKKTEI